MNGQWMAAEIREQPDVLERILVEGRGDIRAVAGAIRDRTPRFVLFVARGTSDHAALYAKYLVETRLGMPAGLMSPSTMTVYGAHPNLKDCLVVAVSQSGSSPDLILPVERSKEGGAVTLAVTNAPGSPLAKAADYHVDIMAGAERAVAATKSFTAQLLVLYLLVDALSHREDGVERLPEWCREILDREDEVARLAIRYRFAEQLLTTARGYSYPTAREAALKLMETSYLEAHSFAGADLLHGPMAMIDRGFPVLAVAPAGPGGDALRHVLERLHDLGADSLVIGDAAAAELSTVSFLLPPDLPEILSPIVAVLPIQQLAWCLARERGADPDQPRGLEKVTRTW